MSSTLPRRRSHDSNMDEEVEASYPRSSRAESAEVSQRNASKRRRISPASSSTSIPSTEPTNRGNGSGQITTDHIAESGRTTPNGGDQGLPLDLPSRTRPHVREHQPGSIVRVTLVNFVTYTSATFHPGPNLNMVIGPNGTGKSTLVCAICLGLGWGPQLLGRAKDLGEFVKHGCSEATIEIELKGRKGKTNPVLRRQIRREGNKSHFFINGQASSQKNVFSLVKGFSIQVDNLCQFLPQDRVVEFAALTPVELLLSTQRAAADPDMVEKHEELKRLRKEQREGETSYTVSKETLTKLETRQSAQRADVEMMQERTEVEYRIDMLSKIRPYAEFQAVRQRYLAMQEKEKTTRVELTALKNKVAPSLQALDDKDKYKRQLEAFKHHKRRQYDKQDKHAENELKQHNDLVKAGHDCDRRITVEKKGDADRKREVGIVVSRIKEIKGMMREPPIEFDAAAYNEQLRSLRRDKNEESMRITNILDSMGELKREEQSRLQRIERAAAELTHLRSQAGQQVGKLRKASSDTAKAWEWVQNNKDAFTGPIYGPPLVECSIKDNRFVNAIESIFQKSELCAFTCTNNADFQKLNTQFYHHMRLHDVYVRTSTQTLDQFRAPVTNELLQELGFEGWAMDFLSGPDPVLSMLCSEARIHATGVASSDGGDAQFQRIQESGIQNWVTPRSTYRIIRRREYGAGAVQTRVTDVRPATYWTSQPVELGVEHDLQDDIAGWTEEIEAGKSKLATLVDQQREHKRRVQELQEAEHKVAEEKDTKQKVVNNFNALPNKLRTQQDKLEQSRTEQKANQDIINNIKKEQSRLLVSKAEAALSFARAAQQACENHADFIKASVALIEATSDLERLKEANQEVTQLVASLQEQFITAQNETKLLKNRGKILTKKLQDIKENDPELDAFYFDQDESLRLRTPEQLEVEIEAQTAHLSLLHESNPNIAKEYEERSKKIESLKAKLSGQESSLALAESQMKTLRTEWEPRLDHLIVQISTAFSALFEEIHCNGEVGIHKAGEDGRDFELWEIQIRVQFREDAQMSILDSHRQSGGERAVSTIFYLMALQSLSRAPFRVVDEINQGMDPANERMVHGQMVDIACGKVNANGTRNPEGNPGSQYFLITPKLLTGLKYNPGMTVHVIGSGEYIDPECNRLDFKSLTESARQMMSVAV